MARQTINIGTTANDRTGDPLRTAFNKVNENFVELYADIVTLNSSVVTDVSDLTDTTNLLFSGNYEDLANIPESPSFPTDISDLTDTTNLLFSGNYEDLANIPESPNFVNIGLSGTSGAGYATLSITTDRDFYIGLNDTSTGAKTFEFGRDGSLIVPGALYVDGNVYGGAGNRLYLAGDIGESVPAIDIPNSAEGATLSLSINNSQGGGVEVITGSGSWLFDDTRLLSFPGSVNYNIGESVDGFNIRSDISFGIVTDASNTAYTWAFGEDGNTVFPGNISSTNGNFTTAVTARNINADGGNISLNPDFGLIFTQSNAVITANTTSWTFGTDGVLTLPAGGDIEADAVITLKAYYGPPGSNHAWQFDGATGTVRKTTSGYMDIGGPSGVKLTATDAPTKIWTFDGNGNLAAPGNITGNILKINDGVHEALHIRSGDGGGFISDFDCSTGSISYCTSVSGNWTANFINLNLDEGYATVLTIVIEQTGTPGYPSAVQIEGSPKTLIWEGNTPPTPTNTGIDVVTFSILRTGIGGNEYVVLGQMTGF